MGPSCNLQGPADSGAKTKPHQRCRQEKKGRVIALVLVAVGVFQQGTEFGGEIFIVVKMLIISE